MLTRYGFRRPFDLEFEIWDLDLFFKSAILNPQSAIRLVCGLDCLFSLRVYRSVSTPSGFATGLVRDCRAFFNV